MTSQGETGDPAHHKTCFEKQWKENVDFFKVENPIVCHDGESIQVSKNKPCPKVNYRPPRTIPLNLVTLKSVSQ
jgi:hypothetical protein